MKNYILYIITAALGILLLIQIFSPTEMNNAMKKNLKALEQGSEISVSDIVGKNFYEMGDSVFERYNGSRFSLKDLEVDPSSTVFIRMSAAGCKPCLDRLINTVEAFKKGRDLRFILLMKDIPLRDMMVLQKQKKFMEVLYVDKLCIDYEEAYRPILFTLSDDGSIKTYHICNKDQWDSTTKYFNEL